VFSSIGAIAERSTRIFFGFPAQRLQGNKPFNKPILISEKINASIDYSGSAVAKTSQKINKYFKIYAYNKEVKGVWNAA